MDPILIVSGLLAVLGGGAGAVAYYRKNYGATASSTPTGSTVGPEGGSPDAGTNSTFENYDSVLASAGGSPIGQAILSKLVTPPIAATPSPYVNPGRPTVAGYTPPAPTKGANTPPAAIRPVTSGFWSGLEAHL